MNKSFIATLAVLYFIAAITTLNSIDFWGCLIICNIWLAKGLTMKK